MLACDIFVRVSFVEEERMDAIISACGRLAIAASKRLMIQTEQGEQSFYDCPSSWVGFTNSLFDTTWQEAEGNGEDHVHLLKRKTVALHNFSVRLLELFNWIPKNAFIPEDKLDAYLMQEVIPRCEEEGPQLKFLIGHPILMIPKEFDIAHFDDALPRKESVQRNLSLFSQQLLFKKLLAQTFYVSYDDMSYLNDIYKTGEKQPADYVYAAIANQVSVVFR